MMKRAEDAVFRGGCFWCLEAIFQEVEGVQSVQSGYAGRTTSNPTYHQVCSGTTGHAEVVRVRFDPGAIDYADLLRIFFTIHDPTTRDRQGNDVGPQYRSIILYSDDAQRETVAAAMREIEAAGLYPDPLVTELVPLGEFWLAEPYHDDYFRKNPNQPYCRIVIDPKVAKFWNRFRDRLRSGG